MIVPSIMRVSFFGMAERSNKLEVDLKVHHPPQWGKSYAIVYQNFPYIFKGGASYP